MEYLRKTSLVLTIIGALNWGSIGIFQFDVDFSTSIWLPSCLAA